MFVLPAHFALLFFTISSESLDIRSAKENNLTSTSNASLTSTQVQKTVKTKHDENEKLNTTLEHATEKQNQTKSQFVPMATNASSTLDYWRTVKLNVPVVTRGIWLTGKLYRPLLLTHGLGVTKKIKVPLNLQFYNKKIEFETDAPTFTRTKSESGSSADIDMDLFKL